MVYYLIHDFNPALDYTDGRIISLYPDVSFVLDKKNIFYQTLEEFYSEEEIFKDRESSFKEFVEWIGIFDDFFCRHISVCKNNRIALARISVNTLKNFIDELFIESCIVNSFLQKVGDCVEIRYVRNSKRKEHTRSPRFFLSEEKSNFLYNIFETVAKKNHAVKILLVENETKKEKGRFRIGYYHWVKVLLKKRLSIVFRALKIFFNIAKYGKLNGALSASGKVRSTLALHPGSNNLDPIIKDLIRRGTPVYALSDGFIFEYSSFFEKKVLDVRPQADNEVYKRIRIECKKASELLKDEDALFTWIERKCKLPVKSVILPFLKHFVVYTCSDVISIGENFTKLYQYFNINNIVATNSNDNYAKGAIISAHRFDNISLSCFQHGIHAYFDPLIFMTDVDPFDNYFTSDPISEKMAFDANELSYINPANIFQSPHKLLSIRNLYKKNSARLHQRKSTIIYVPTKVISYRRHLTAPTYPIGWYYEYQKRLMDYFGTQEGYRFIYKQPVTERQLAYRSIIPYFKERYLNIILKTGKLYDYFPQADGIIIDRPMTSLFEAADSGLPVICLCADFVSIGIPEAVKEFLGRTLQTFSTYDEAISSLKVFLEEPDPNYIINMDLGQLDSDFVLNSLHGREGVGN